MGILSDKLSAVKPSQTKAMTELAETMRKTSKDLQQTIAGDGPGRIMAAHNPLSATHG